MTAPHAPQHSDSRLGNIIVVVQASSTYTLLVQRDFVCVAEERWIDGRTNERTGGRTNGQMPGIEFGSF